MTDVLSTATWWSEMAPPLATSPRGWLHRMARQTGYLGNYPQYERGAVSDTDAAHGKHHRVAIGWYLDYGADHYRSGHQYCRYGNCAECEPGTVLASVYADDHPTLTRWFATVEEAKAWVEATHYN